MSTALWVGIGGFAGALARYGLTLLIGRLGTLFPLATFLINVTGCAALGVLVGAGDSRGLSPVLRPLVGVGFLGAYTTFSTFGVETLRLALDGYSVLAIVYVGASVAVGLLAALAGLQFGRAL